MVIETTLPNGNKVRFDKEEHTYDLEIIGIPPNEPGWVRVPSVTTILNMFHKPALVWWGMQTGVRGLVELVNKDAPIFTHDEEGKPKLRSEEEITPLLTEHKLTVNHVAKAAGTRGTNVHDWANAWARQEDIPDDVRPEEQPYVDAFQLFVSEKQPEVRKSEIPVASWEFLWAGTPDLLATIEGELWLLDYKTSKRVYETHYAQLAFYAEGLRESGYITLEEYATLRQGVVLLQANGKYKLVENTHVHAGDVHNIIAGYHGFKALKPPPKRKKKNG